MGDEVVQKQAGEGREEKRKVGMLAQEATSPDHRGASGDIDLIHWETLSSDS